MYEYDLVTDGSTTFFLKGLTETNGLVSCGGRSKSSARGLGDRRDLLSFSMHGDANHPEHYDIRGWVGEDFAPEYFAADEINRKLRRRTH